MSDATLAEVTAWQCLDSRGQPTVAVRVTTDGGAVGRTIAPAGASTGSHEASELRDLGAEYDGAAVSGAVRNVRTVIAPALLGIDCGDQERVDSVLEQLDGTPDLGRLGANAAVAVSLAVLQTAAHHTCTQLYRHLAPGPDVLLPRPMVNIFSGGAHAGGVVDIQDVLAVPLTARTFAEAIEHVWRVRRATRALLQERGHQAGLVADEGGLAAPLPTNRAAIELVTDGIARAGLAPGADVAIAIDVAATQFAADGGYRFAAESRSLDAYQLCSEIAGWCASYPIVSLEDPLAEDDWSGWLEATRRLGLRRQLLGDDLFVTDASRLRRGIDAGVANAVLVKPNQAGTVSRAAEVMRVARDAGYRTVLSARSGDTEETWLADLAVGWRTAQIKVGSTMRSERTAKWNRLLEIEATEGSRAVLAPFPAF